MQLPLPFRSSARSGSRSLVVGRRRYDLLVVRHPQARRYVLRVTSDGVVRLTVPRGASIAGGLRFAEQQAEWIERERLRRTLLAKPWRDGTVLWFRGERVGVRVSSTHIACGAELVPALEAGQVRRTLETHFLALAQDELPPRCLALARRCGFSVARIDVRNQRSRWGSCTPRGVITLNWRLIQMPLTVRDYVILHELAHLRHSNHSRRFWRQVESICEGWQEAERWLRRHGREIL